MYQNIIPRRLRMIFFNDHEIVSDLLCKNMQGTRYINEKYYLKTIVVSQILSFVESSMKRSSPSIHFHTGTRVDWLGHRNSQCTFSLCHSRDTGQIFWNVKAAKCSRVFGSPLLFCHINFEIEPSSTGHPADNRQLRAIILLSHCLTLQSCVKKCQAALSWVFYFKPLWLHLW